MRVHFSNNYLLRPLHKVTIELIGLGGTGSLVLTNLARMNEALIGLGHPGLHVRCWDYDTVSESNAGRQLFSPADIGMFKSQVLVNRINRFFGTSWEAMTVRYNAGLLSNIIITCIDTAKGRVSLSEKITQNIKQLDSLEPVDVPLYWLDFGNAQKKGQCIIGTLQKVKQPKSEFETASTLPTVIKKFPQLRKIKETDEGPSCSLAEALLKQDLFINSTLAQFGCNILWKLFREGMLKYNGCYINLDTCTVNPIKI